MNNLKDFVEFCYYMHLAVCNLILVPVVSWLKGISLKEAYDRWYLHYIEENFFK